MRLWHSAGMGLILFLSLHNANALATLLVNYPQLVRAVENADDVKAIIHFSNCNVIDEALSLELARQLDGATTRFNFTQYLHFKQIIDGQFKDTVTTSFKSYVEQSSGDLWYIFGRLSVYEDNTAIIHVEYIDPVNHKQQLTINWLCNISNGRDENGLFLYDFP